jgi:hypothetical protein
LSGGPGGEGRESGEREGAKVPDAPEVMKIVVKSFIGEGEGDN